MKSTAACPADKSSTARVVLAVAAVGFASWAYAVSPLHGLSSGDELVPVLASTQHLSLFYWGADRFGMLLPLLAHGIRDPLRNLVVQNFLGAFLAFSSFFAACRFFFGKADWLAAGTAMTLVALLWPPAEPRGDYMSIGQSFAPSAALLFAGLPLLGIGRDTPAGAPAKPVRMLAGFGLLCASFWVNLAMFFTALPLALGSCVLGRAPGSGGPEWGRRVRRALWAGGLTVLALAVNLLLMRIFAARYATADYGYLPLPLWPEALAAIAAHFVALFYANPGRNAVLAGLALASGAALFRLWRQTASSRPEIVPFLAAACLVVAASLANYMGYGTNAWVRINHYEGRYLSMVQFLATCLVCGAVAMALRLVLGERLQILTIALVVLIAPVSVGSYGVPSPARLEEALDKRLGVYAARILELGCTHVAGDYWKVWPLVFHANVLRHGQGGRPLWGVSYRSENTADIWAERVAGPWRVCTLRGDAQADAYLEQFRLTEIERVEMDGPHFAH